MRSIEIIDGKEFYVVEFNLGILKSEDQFRKNLAEAFEIPKEYAKNLDALDESMRDLCWIDQSHYKIKLKNKNSLQQRNLKLYDFIIETFNFYKNFWLNKSSNKGVDNDFDFVIEIL